MLGWEPARIGHECLVRSANLGAEDDYKWTLRNPFSRRSIDAVSKT